jgi:tetratricopeptide (TPR) repeat protein
MDIENILNGVKTFLFGPPPAINEKDLPKCNRFLETEEAYHFCMLDRNLLIHEAVRKRAEEATFADADKALAKLQSSRNAFSLARRVNFQTDNWLLLSAARLSTHEAHLYMYQNKMELAQRALNKARSYVEAALENYNPKVTFDIQRFTDVRDLKATTVHPVEGYFELRTTQIDIMLTQSILDPSHQAHALQISEVLNRELENARFLHAQGVDPKSSEGYINRIRMTIVNHFLSNLNPNHDPMQWMGKVDLAYQWAGERYNQWVVTTWANGSNLKDLLHDRLAAQLTRGRILLLSGKEDEAVKIFQEVLNHPTTTRVYGGFLDLGLDALFYLLGVAIYNSSSREEAAKKASAIIDWNKINQLVDVKEAVGLFIRERDWRGDVAAHTRVEVGNHNNFTGDLALHLRSSWAPSPKTNMISQVNLGKLSDQQKLATLMDTIGRSRQNDNVLVYSMLVYWNSLP